MVGQNSLAAGNAALGQLKRQPAPVTYRRSVIRQHLGKCAAITVIYRPVMVNLVDRALLCHLVFERVV